MGDVKEKKKPKVSINGQDVTRHVTGKIVYGDVVTDVTVEVSKEDFEKITTPRHYSMGVAERGCEHGRWRDQPCPHCMGIGSASPTVNAKGHAEATEITPAEFDNYNNDTDKEVGDFMTETEHLLRNIYPGIKDSK